MPGLRWAAGAILVLFANGCGSAPPQLEGAVYADQIPIYSPAQLTESMGGTTSDFEGNDASYSLSWWLETSAARHDIEAWYDAKLPNVRKTHENWGDGSVTVYQWSPKGGKPGEQLSVVISDEDIQITESVSTPRP